MAESDKTFTQEQLDAAIADAVGGLKKNRDELLAEAKAAKDRLKNYDGVDPDEFKKLKAEAEDAQRRKATADGDFKALEKQLVERHQAELTGRDAKVAKLTKAVEKRAIRQELTAALVRSKALPDMLDLLVERGEKFARLKETDEDYVPFIVGEDGKQAFADGIGTPMGFDAFVEQSLKAKYPRAFEGSGASGGGASRSTASGGGSKTIARNDSRAFAANLDDILAGKIEVDAA